MSHPGTLAQSALKRLGRYTLKHKRLVYKFPWQLATHIDVHSDTDWAGCPRIRKSTSGGAVMIGSHIIRTYSSTLFISGRSGVLRDCKRCSSGSRAPGDHERLRCRPAFQLVERFERGAWNREAVRFGPFTWTLTPFGCMQWCSHLEMLVQGRFQIFETFFEQRAAAHLWQEAMMDYFVPEHWQQTLQYNLVTQLIHTTKDFLHITPWLRVRTCNCDGVGGGGGCGDGSSAESYLFQVHED